MHEPHHEHHHHGHHHHGHHAMVHANPGSAGWAAGGAFAGRVVGGIPGLIVAAATATEDSPSYVGAALRWMGQIGGAAGGAAIGAPPELKARAAVGAAIGGAIPFIGAPLAAVGAYVATRPKDRTNNPAGTPMSTGATVALVALGLAVLGGGTYFGVKALRAREDEKNGEPEPEPENVDEWGTDMDKNEHWGAGPVTGQDGEEYAYVIYHNLEADTYWIAYRGESQTGSTGPIDTGEEAAWCVENRLPSPCFGYPGAG